MEKKWLKKYLMGLKFQSKWMPDAKTKKQKRPFIIPSRFGFYFGGGILVLIALAYTYANQLIYLIAFFYASILFITMHLTNNNIKSVEISEYFIGNFFQDENGSIKVTLQNNHSKYSARFIQVDIVDFDLKTVVSEIPPNSYKTVEFSLHQKNRGQFEYSKIVLSSKFPFNLFYSWKRLTWAEDFYVYPARDGAQEPPYSSEDELSKKLDLTSAHLDSKSDNFLGHKEYTPFDNYKRIDWKVYARKNKFFVKTFETESSRICFVDFLDFFKKVPDLEKRIRQLTKWVFDAQKGNALFLIRNENDEIMFLDDRKKYEFILKKLSTLSAKDFA